MRADKLYTIEQIQAWDQYTIQNEPIASIDLMERASLAFVDWFVSNFNKPDSIGIYCGPGNNGGDGYAVGRLLLAEGFKVQLFSIGKHRSEDGEINFGRVSDHVKSVNDISDLESDFDILIDGIFGSGLSRPVEGLFAEVISELNNARAIKVSIDIPSGMFGDAINSQGAIFNADYTGTFQIPKRSMLMPESADHCRSFTVLDIGLHTEYDPECNWFYVKESENHERTRFSHKGSFGKALIIAGSTGKMGACILASRAALRSGCGLLVSYIPAEGNEILQIAVPEAMTITDSNPDFITNIPDLGGYSAIGIGPGLGTNNKTGEAVKKLLKENKLPIVIDADALNLIAEHRMQDLLSNLCVLTPHPKEFERLFGRTENSFDAISVQRKEAQNLNCTIIRKGAYTSIAATDGKIYFNSTGNSGMATAGSGDVLTGVITALLAQGLIPLEAAIHGVYQHGLAGDHACEERGEENMISGDIIDHLFR